MASNSPLISGRRIALAGKLASMSRRDAAQLLRQHGAVVLDRTDGAEIVVLGEHDLPAPATDLSAWLDDAAQAAAESGELVVITETELWQRLGLVEDESDIQRLYTPAMLADLLGVEVAVIRRWHRRGLIRPKREVRRLPYFDFREVATARRLVELLAAGVSPKALERQLTAMGRWLPNVDRPLAQLSIIVEGKGILLRQGEGLVEPGGQLRFDFESADAEDAPASHVTPRAVPAPGPVSALLADRNSTVCLPLDADQLRTLAAELEDDGQLAAAAEMYRAAMAAGGPKAELCFQVAELLYRQNDLAGARERYYMAIELNEDYVEARANLGCVLVELEQLDLAIAAFEGALKFHPDYADVHYLLARALDEAGRAARAEDHWHAFLELAPDSPWADEARQRLAGVVDRLFD